MISAIYSLALTTGANRVVKGARIEHVCGDPSLGDEADLAYGMSLRLLQHYVNRGPQLHSTLATYENPGGHG